MNIYAYALGWPWLAAVFNILMLASWVIAILRFCFRAVD